jgi:mannitol-specific phosphotransferase system IIBC component
MSEPITDIARVLTSLSVAIAEAALLLQQQKEMQESHVSDLNQRRDVEKMEKLKKETARLRLAVRKSRDADKRRSDLEKQRKRLRKRF